MYRLSTPQKVLSGIGIAVFILALVGIVLIAVADLAAKMTMQI